MCARGKKNNNNKAACVGDGSSKVDTDHPVKDALKEQLFLCTNALLSTAVYWTPK